MKTGDMNTGNESFYPATEWSAYARLFAAVTTSVQLAVYREACTYLRGDVVDCGCGAAKIAPLLADNEEVLSYTGIDYAQEMVAVARWVVGTLQRPDFSIHQGKIEELGGSFTSGISTQSYYSWPEPLVTLRHIFGMLADGAVFVLATPNRNLRPEKLLKEAEKELLAHPDFPAYKAYNLKLATNPQANFISMDALVRQVQQVGFQVLECHQRHFEGGLNFLVLHKGV